MFIYNLTKLFLSSVFGKHFNFNAMKFFQILLKTFVNCWMLNIQISRHVTSWPFACCRIFFLWMQIFVYWWLDLVNWWENLNLILTTKKMPLFLDLMNLVIQFHKSHWYRLRFSVNVLSVFSVLLVLLIFDNDSCLRFNKFLVCFVGGYLIKVFSLVCFTILVGFS